MTTTTVRPVPGQTWKRKGGAARYIVLHVAEVEGFTYVLYRLWLDEPGQLVRCALVDEFLADHDQPEWSAPEPRRHYAAVYMDDGRLDFGKSHSSAKAAHKHADPGAVGVVKVTTTYEWVTEDGAE